MKKIILKALISFIIPLLSFSEELLTPDGGKYLIEKEKIIYKDKSGEERWQINLPGSDIRKPSVLPNGNIIFISFFKSIKSFLKGTNYEFFVKFEPNIYFLICVQKENGKILWVLPIAFEEEDNSNAVFFKGSAFISSAFYLMKINYENGEIVKRYFIGNAVEKIDAENGYLKIIIDTKNNFYYKFDGEKFFEKVLPFYNKLIFISRLMRVSSNLNTEFYISNPDGFFYSKLIFASKKKKKEIDLTEHRNYYEKLISKDKTNPYFHFYLGQANFWLQNFDEAEKEFNETLNLSKEYPFFEAFWIGYFFEIMGMPEWADKFYEVGIKKEINQISFKPPFNFIIIKLVIFPTRFCMPWFFFNGNIPRFKHLLKVKRAIFPSYIEGDLVFEKFYYKWLEKNGYYEEAKKEKERYKRDLKNPFNFIENNFFIVFKAVCFFSSLFCLFFAFIILSFSIIKISRKMIFGIFLLYPFILFFLIQGFLGFYFKEIIFPSYIYIYAIFISIISFLNFKKAKIKLCLILCSFILIYFVLYFYYSYIKFKGDYFLYNAIFIFYLIFLIFIFIYFFKNNINNSIKYFSIMSIISFLFFGFLFIITISSQLRFDKLPLDTNNFGNPFFNEFLKKCSNEKPKNNYAKFMLGLSYQMMENYDEALKYYEMAKNEEDALNNMGVIYYEKGDIKKAEEYFLKASEKGNVASYYNLYLIKGDKKYFEIAKKLDEDWVLSFSKYSEGKFMLSSINPRKYYNLIFKWRIPKWKELKYYLFL